eukprot:1608778-Rhodomonas_salina.2
MQGRSVPRLAGVLVLLLVVSAEVEGQSNKVENHYKILDVEPGASASEIRSAYHKESLKWHPDKNQGSKEAEKMFIKVQEAYQVLKDPNRRAAFDAAWKYQQRSRCITTPSFEAFAVGCWVLTEDVTQQAPAEMNRPRVVVNLGKQEQTSRLISTSMS